jgi:hypothetical protein
MTVRKHFKALVRERMQKTGESYTSARRQLLKHTTTVDPATRWHFPGSVPATTALRVLLAAAGVRAPHTSEPFSEAMLFGIAGGIGIGVAAFRYEKEDFSSFFVAGRHLWYDDLGYLTNALKQFGIKPAVKESGGAKAAEKQLRDALTGERPCVAWVDMANLPHRALPTHFSGSGYHIVPVYRIDDNAKRAIIGDLTDDPIAIPLADLAVARARIKKQAHRVLSIADAAPKLDLAELVRAGLRACHRALTAKPGKGPLAMSTLDSLTRWRDRLANSKDKENWEKMFKPGINLWRALTSIHQFIEYYGTGGGLCRPLMADFLNEAASALGDSAMKALALRYVDLGDQWSALAEAALHDGVPALRAAKRQYAQYAELFTSNGSLNDKRAVWTRLDELAAQMKECFPLSDVQCAELRAELQARVTNIITGEEAALAEMASIAA